MGAGEASTQGVYIGCVDGCTLILVFRGLIFVAVAVDMHGWFVDVDVD